MKNYVIRHLEIAVLLYDLSGDDNISQHEILAILFCRSF